MVLKCNYPGCKKNFPVDCPTSEITEHIAQKHKVDVFDPVSLVNAFLGIKIALIIGESVYKQLDQKEFVRVARRFRYFWKLIESPVIDKTVTEK